MYYILMHSLSITGVINFSSPFLVLFLQFCQLYLLVNETVNSAGMNCVDKCDLLLTGKFRWNYETDAICGSNNIPVHVKSEYRDVCKPQTVK